MSRQTLRSATIATTIALTGLLAPLAATPAAAGCVLAGGEATMITSDLAKFMANAALKNSIAGMGAKPAGKIKMTCKDSVASTHCIARQRACK
ncbi:MAG: hypothetical protein AB7E80_13890 [Hyphomicrobiaceae bacterium]